MRLYKYLCVFVIVIAIFSGCTSFGANKPMYGTKSGRKIFLMLTTDQLLGENSLAVRQIFEEIYYIEMVTYHYKNIHIEYPKIQGLKDKEREEKINSAIKDYILLDIVGTDNSDYLNELNMELECRITLQSRELLSFCYVGRSNIDGFKPFDEFYSMTFDVKNVKELKLSDLVEIDETLVERIKSSTDVSNQGLEENGDNLLLQESLLHAIQDKDAEDYIEYLAKGYSGFVLEPDALVIETRVAYALGVYALIRLPGRIVNNHFIFDEF